MAESMTVCRVVNVSAGGTWNVFQGSTTTAFSILDNATLFGLGAEYPGIFAVYHFVPQGLGANGTGGTGSTATGGNYLAAHFATATPGTPPPPRSVRECTSRPAPAHPCSARKVSFRLTTASTAPSRSTWISSIPARTTTPGSPPGSTPIIP